MAEYIDRNLIEWYGRDFENDSCKNRECSGCSYAECSHSQVMQIPTADVIEREKIVNAIKEMEDYRDGFAFIGKHDLENVVDNCIRILEKHIGENE